MLRYRITTEEEQQESNQDQDEWLDWRIYWFCNSKYKKCRGDIDVVLMWGPLELQEPENFGSQWLALLWLRASLLHRESTNAGHRLRRWSCNAVASLWMQLGHGPDMRLQRSWTSHFFFPVFVVQAKSGCSLVRNRLFCRQTQKDQCLQAIMTDLQKEYYVRVLTQ